jgi:phosphoribosyl 1,2-cyclic phosphodiesterase
MPVQFAVLASGSQGNAALIQVGAAGVLLDFGLGPRALAQRLASVGASWSRIGSALLTHTHGDHVDNATLHAMARQRMYLYCHEGHRGVLGGMSGFRALDEAALVRHYDDRPFLGPSGFGIEPVELKHDGGPTFGFRIEARTGRGDRAVSLGYMADTGCWSDGMADALADVDVLGIEFNHDVEMQRRSRRSPVLIARNLGDWGHLSNEQGAGLVAAVLDRSRPEAPRHVVLLHLSQQCNRPQLALQTAHVAVKAAGRRVKIHAAQQGSAHPNLLIDGPRRRSRLVKADRRPPSPGSPPADPR